MTPLDEVLELDDLEVLESHQHERDQEVQRIRGEMLKIERLKLSPMRAAAQQKAVQDAVRGGVASVTVQPGFSLGER